MGCVSKVQRWKRQQAQLGVGKAERRIGVGGANDPAAVCSRRWQAGALVLEILALGSEVLDHHFVSLGMTSKSLSDLPRRLRPLLALLFLGFDVSCSMAVRLGCT